MLLAIATVPSWYMLKVGMEIEESLLASACELRLDKCACYAESVTYATILNYVG